MTDMIDTAPVPDNRRRRTSLDASLLLVSILVVAVGLRAWNFPREREFRDIDEGGYIQSSLALAEGMTPTFKASPGGLQLWLGWGYIMSKTASYTVWPTEEERAASLELRPYVALNHALWETYYNFGPIRRFELIFIGLLSALAVVPAFGLGHRFAGLPGAALAAGLTATLPVLVSLSGHTRPYSPAWSIALFSLWLTVRGAPGGRWVAGSILLGLAVATRIEMLCLLPFVLAEHWINSPRPGRHRRILSMIGLTAVVTMAAAPWFFVGLMGSLKTIVAVRLMAGGAARQSIARVLRELLIHQAVLVPLALIIMAIVLPLPAPVRRYRWLALLSGLLSITALRPSGYGPQHDGPVYLLLVVYAAVGLAAIAQQSPRLGYTMVGIALVLSLSQTLWKIHRDRAEYCFADSNRWIEAHIPAGTRVYYNSGNTGPILPTPEAANYNWLQVVAPDAWEKKFRWGATRLGVASAEPPRALSIDLTAKDVGFMRGWFILGGRSQVNLPRYDLRVYGTSEVFNRYDLPAEFAKGACVVAATGLVEGLGEPTVKWMHNGQVRAAVYCTSDIVAKLQKPQ